MNVLIRADENPAMGSGHVMRMLALSQALLAEGHSVVFVAAEYSESFAARLSLERLTFRKLGQVEIATNRDLLATIDIAKEFSCGWVVLDGYGFDIHFQCPIRQSGFRLLWVDDYRFAEKFSADIVLNPNLDVSVSDYRFGSDNETYLLGSDYCLLRKEFWDVSKSTVGTRSSGRKHVLVSFGGSDPANATAALLQCLETVDREGYAFRIVLGAGYPFADEVRHRFRDSLADVAFLRNVQSMNEQYEWADSIIAAVGGTTWEWLRYELTAAILPIADNQLGLVQALVDRNAATRIGSFEDGKVQIDNKLLSRWLDSLLSQKTKTPPPIAIDGKGAKRVAEAMMKYAN